VRGRPSPTSLIRQTAQDAARQRNEACAAAFKFDLFRLNIDLHRENLLMEMKK
jgi:hypothetical protein